MQNHISILDINNNELKTKVSLVLQTQVSLIMYLYYTIMQTMATFDPKMLAKETTE